MAKLTEKERGAFEEIFKADMEAINAKFYNQVKDFWALARIAVMKRRGWDTLEQEKRELKQQQERIVQRIHEIEGLLTKEDLRPEQVVELGGRVNDYDRYRDANFYGIPVTSQFEYEIVEYIRERIDLEIPSKLLRDICLSAIRELAMAGTFEEARDAYSKFYSLDFRKYGVDIPPRLADVAKNHQMLLIAKESLNQAQKLEAPKEPEKGKK